MGLKNNFIKLKHLFNREKSREGETYQDRYLHHVRLRPRTWTWSRSLRP